MMDHADIRRIAHEMGLNARTVEDLLAKGWKYEESLGHPRRWVGPEVNLEKK